MGKYFGTDGARGRANDTLTLDMACLLYTSVSGNWMCCLFAYMET